MSVVANATRELNKRHYNWSKDKRRLKYNGVIPWDRCINCATKVEQLSDKYCSRCQTLTMFKQACDKAEHLGIFVI